MICKFLLASFFIFFNLTFADIYTPKTATGKEELINLKKQQITIGLLDEPLYNISYPNIPSLNSLVQNFFKEYLDLNVTFKNVSYKNLKNELENGNIDGVALIPKNNIYHNYLNFSSAVFSEELYVVSQEKKLHSLEDLNDQIVYTSYMKSYNNIFNTILNNNELDAYLIPVDNLDNYKEKFILTTTPALYTPEYTLKISKSSGVSIAFTNKYKKFIPLINDALKTRFVENILTNLKALIDTLSFNNFYSSLTEEEKEYLKTPPSIKVVYENEYSSIISYKSEIDNSYKGVAPNIFKELHKILNINFIDYTENNSLSNTPQDLKDKKVDIMLLSKTRIRSNEFIFSKKIYELGSYIINLDNGPTSSRTLGVIKNNAEEHIAKRYDVDENIVTFTDFNKMVVALDKGYVGNLLVTNKENFDSNKYNIIFFENLPINFAFDKNNLILKNIIDKAFKHVIDLKKITDISKLERDLENRTLYLKNKEIQKMFVIFAIMFFILLISISTYLYVEHINKKTLLKDSLTNLPNRFIFDKFCKENDSLIGYTFVIDLNNFKKVNDSFGHEFGDQILKEFANFLKNNFITSYIFRVSGDEFYGFSFEEPNDIISRLNRFREFCPTLNKNGITFNIGLCKKSSDISLTTSFKYSDLAMLETKKEKNLFFKIADKYFVEKMNKENNILSILKEDISGIFPVFQPKFSINSKELIGAESLARYSSSKFGLISPFEFIPIAEKYGFIHKVDYKIANDSIAFIGKLLKENALPKNFRISFNISMKTFKRTDLILVISGLLNHFKVPGKYIEIEITESIFILDMKDLITKLKELKKLGIQISLDDFTAGHSTAGLLPLLPIDIVKFDKSLLDSIEVNRNKGEIVYRNLTSLIHDLNFKIVAEGVETKKQLLFLKSLKIDYAQGYYFSKPISKEVFYMEVIKHDS